MNILFTCTRHLAVWWNAWRMEKTRPHAAMLNGKAVEFLPAVLEIEMSPPSPIGRAILWTIVVALCAAIAWSGLSWVDIVAVAPGKIIPSGHSKTIQPYETGVISAIHVQDGQVVKQGETLIELDPTQNKADRDRALNEYRSALVEAARLRALIAEEDTFIAPTETEPSYVHLQRELLKNQLAEYRARVEAALQLIAQRRAARGQTTENIRRLKATVPMESERADAYRRLMERDAVTKLDYLQAEQQRIDKRQELARQRERLIQDQAALEEAEKNLRALMSEFHHTKQEELSALETKAVSLLQEVTKAGQKAKLQRLVSPIDGVVQQLSVHTITGVVTPAQPLLIVVPQDYPVEVEAQIENKDIGFVKEGQVVEVKIETFPFTIYGTIPGKVLTVSDDAVPLDKEKDGLVYTSRVSMDRSTMKIQGKQINLSPGMAVTVEINTGKRRVIEYLLSPLLKSIKESIRER